MKPLPLTPFHPLGTARLVLRQVHARDVDGVRAIIGARSGGAPSDAAVASRIAGAPQREVRGHSRGASGASPGTPGSSADATGWSADQPVWSGDMARRSPDTSGWSSDRAASPRDEPDAAPRYLSQHSCS